MENALRLPSAVRGALMPDAHLGYGLPIGGVLATEGTVIPYAVGVDIACRMKLTVLDLPPDTIDRDPQRLERALLRETQFGVGAKLRERADHEVLDADRWAVTPITRPLRAEGAPTSSARAAPATTSSSSACSSSPQPDLGLEAGRYLALLSHSGSRGAGAQVASHYSKLARDLHPELPAGARAPGLARPRHRGGRRLLGGDEPDGRVRGGQPRGHPPPRRAAPEGRRAGGVENHHNYCCAWHEDARRPRRASTARAPRRRAQGVLGVIPGSMASPAFVVRGRGGEDSLHSASHGAGRVMSRTAAKERFTWKEVRPLLEQARVRLLSAGIDENPLVYRDITPVIAAQADLVDVVATFHPRIVRMADAGERPED